MSRRSRFVGRPAPPSRAGARAISSRGGGGGVMSTRVIAVSCRRPLLPRFRLISHFWRSQRLSAVDSSSIALATLWSWTLISRIFAGSTASSADRKEVTSWACPLYFSSNRSIASRMSWLRFLWIRSESAPRAPSHPVRLRTRMTGDAVPGVPAVPILGRPRVVARSTASRSPSALRSSCSPIAAAPAPRALSAGRPDGVSLSASFARRDLEGRPPSLHREDGCDLRRREVHVRQAALALVRAGL